MTETVRVRGEALVDRVKTVVREGNVRRITIRNDAGHTVMELPVTASVVAAILAPMLAAVAAIAALAAHWEIEIDRAPEPTTPADSVDTVAHTQPGTTR
jgi:hypothetical protein